MTIPRFFLAASSTLNNEKQTIESSQIDLIKQVSKVLRMKIGDRLDFLDGQGQLLQCVLTSFTKQKLTAQIRQRVFLTEEGKPQITVALSLLKGSRFDWALEKLTELGADKIVPLIFERTVVRLDFEKPASDKDKSGRTKTKISRWQSIVKEATEQSERSTLPEITSVFTFPQFLDQCKTGVHSQLHLVCAQRQAAPYLRDSLGNALTRFGASSITIVIGPEGGLTSAELLAATTHGFLAVSLGTRILRSETAAIYALAIVASSL